MPFGKHTSPEISKQRATLPYYSAEYGAQLMRVLDDILVNNTRKSWTENSTGMKESTLKVRLYNSLRWLREEGTPRQQEVAAQFKIMKLGHEFIVVLRRPSVEKDTGLLDEAITRNEPAPIEQPRVKNGGLSFAAIRAEVMDFVMNTTYDGKVAARPAYEVIAVSLTVDQVLELRSIVEGFENFVMLAKDGHKGNIRIFPLSPEEMGALSTKGVAA